MSDYAAKKRPFSYLFTPAENTFHCFFFFILPDASCVRCDTSRRVKVGEMVSDDGRNHRVDMLKRKSFAETWENLKKKLF